MTIEMGDKQRQLPLWMVKTKDKLPQIEGNDRSLYSSRKIRRKRLERVTVYCMNEAEFVDTARSLIEDRHWECGAVNHTVLRRTKKLDGGEDVKLKRDSVRRKRRSLVDSDEGENLSDSRPEERTYVSETDLEGADLEPLGSAAEPLAGEPGVSGTALPLRAGTEGRNAEHEGGALQLVREIFFT